jgi:hypothetical protein
MRRLISLAGTALALATLTGGEGLAAPATGGDGNSWQANDDDALLFDVRLSQYRLGDGVRGYQTPEGVCVDLADMIMALDIPVRLDKKLRRATGWAFAESRTIILDRESYRAQIMNKPEALRPSDIRDTPEGWCVSAAKLSNWLGVQLKPDIANALLIIKAETRLPVELAMERKARASKIRPVAQFDLKTLPNSSAPYRGIKAPSFDAVVSVGGLKQSNGQKRLDVSYELFAAGEIGPVAYDARLASDQRGVPNSLRVKAYRTDPEGGLLGPLKATQVAVGDVAGFTTALVAKSTSGRGAMISNRPVDRPDSFARTDFRGELPLGWDAELYRNDQLLAFAVDRSDGRYEFLDVPLLYGQNRFEIVLYGPQGQIRREEKQVPVGQDSIPPRSSYYWAGINQDGRDLLGLGRGPPIGSGLWRGTVGVERGLNTKTSIMLGLHSLGLKEVGRRNFAEAAIRRAIGPTLVELGASSDLRGGFAAQFQLLGQLRNTYISVESGRAWNGYRSDRFDRSIRGLHAISLDHSLRLGRLTLPTHVEARLTERGGGETSLNLSGRMSTSFGRYYITSELDWQRNRRPVGPDPPDQLDSRFLINGRFGRVRLRGETRFRLSGGPRFEGANLTAEWSGKGDIDRIANWRAELGYDRPRRRGRAAIGYVRHFDKVALTGQLEGATDGAVAASINLAFSFGPDPRKNQDGKSQGWRITSDRLAAGGQVLARVYRDVNGDGRRQADEPLEKDIQLAAGTAPVRNLTDANGEVLIDQLPVFMAQLIGIDASSLPDPYIQPSGPGVVIIPRPGVSATVELALTGAGEVEGTLIRDGGNGIEGVDLELFDGAGRVVSRTRSDFDGFFLFEKVPYGKYSLRIAKASADAVRVEAALTGQVEIDGKQPTGRFGLVAVRPVLVKTAQGQSP